MKKLMKRIGAVLMAVAMMAALGVSAWAVAGTDTAPVSITNIQKGATVKLYRIAEGQYGGTNNASFKGYKWVNGVKTDAADSADDYYFNPEDPTEKQITKIAEGIQADPQVVAATEMTDAQQTIGDTGKYSWNAPAGVYIALITPPADGSERIYNPIVLSTFYNSSDSLTFRVGDKTNGDASVDVKTALMGTEGVAKSSTPTVDKKIKSGIVKDGTRTDSNGDTVDRETAGLNDVVTYEITAVRPTYPADAINKTMFVTDTLSDGLTFNYDSIVVAMGSDTYKVNEGALQKYADDAFVPNTVIGQAKKDGNGFNINFNYDKLTADPVITYTGTVNENAVVGNPGNPNDVTYQYSRNPTHGQTHDTPDKPTPQEAEDLEEKKDEEIVYTYQLAIQKIDPATDETLEGAEFDVYEADKTTKIGHIVSNSNGVAVLTDVVSKGTYYLKETKAPTGYSIDESWQEIDASWDTCTKTISTSKTTRTYTSDPAQAMPEYPDPVGWLKDDKFYEEQPEGELGVEVVPAYVASETEETTEATIVETNEGGAGVATININNTKMSELPSTGGIGTYIFTIAGVAIMAVAAGLLIVRHKKKAE